MRHEVEAQPAVLAREVRSPEPEFPDLGAQRPDLGQQRPDAFLKQARLERDQPLVDECADPADQLLDLGIDTEIHLCLRLQRLVMRCSIPGCSRCAMPLRDSTDALAPVNRILETPVL
jgi:hypothetical protein